MPLGGTFTVILSRRDGRRDEEHGGEGPGGWAARGALPPPRSFAAVVRVPAAIPAAQPSEVFCQVFGDQAASRPRIGERVCLSISMWCFSSYSSPSFQSRNR